MATTRRPGGTPKNPRRTTSPRAGSPTSARAPAARPAVAARGRRPREEARTPRPLRGLAILAAALLILAITLVPALRSTLSQQGQIDGLRDRIARQRETVAALRAEQRQWADQAYVEQQARDRLKLVRVGDKSFTVIDGPAAPVRRVGTQIAAPVKTAAANIPWYGQVWQSMEMADAPAKATKGQPTPTPAVPAAPAAPAAR